MKYSNSPLILDITDFPLDFSFYNDQFPPLDALTYWHFLKKAKNVIEIGCGHSTKLSWKSGVNLIAIDPQPRVFSTEIPYILNKVQNVSLNVFGDLEENDILFIDSSHIYEDGSDVKYLLEVIIPTLPFGVLIHFHDFFGEEGYPKSWQEHPEMGKWNENQYVTPLLESHEVLSINYLISKEHNEELLKTYPFVPTDIVSNMGAVKGASLWLKVI